MALTTILQISQPRILRQIRGWVDGGVRFDDGSHDANRIDWLRAVPFIGMHLACLGVIWVGISGIALAVAGLMYAICMFALTGFYHRYFSHRAFSTSRTVQFAFALIGACCVQCGPLWWDAHHRKHHSHADTELDSHSPTIYGFIWSHVGRILP